MSFDPNSRCAIEVALANTTVFIFGEVTSKANLNEDIVIEIAKKAIKESGYDDIRFIFEAESAKYHVN